ncbi:MAG TPA: DedA family protein [Sphingomonas sp.]|nr:DedA family protein [Sphingomonas sp.]
MSIEALVARYGLAALFVGAGVEGETVTVAGGMLAHRGLLPLPGAMIAAAAGSFVADQMFFAAGRHFRERPRVQRIAARPAFAKALAALERHPTGFIVAFRFLYGLRTISPIAIGTTRVSMRRFVVLNALAAAMWGVLFTGVGYLFGQGFERLMGRVRPSHETLLAGIGAVLLLVLAIGACRWSRGRAA